MKEINNHGFTFKVKLGIAAAFFAFSVSHAQINLNEVPIEKAFQNIQKKTGYNFFYEKDLVSQLSPVSIQTNDNNIENIISQLSLRTGLNYKIFGKQISVFAPANSSSISERPIKGVVVDNTGNPVANAKVTNKGDEVTTNAKGEFVIDAENGDKLIIMREGIGTISYVVNPDSQNIKIQISEKIKEIDEVILVGYSRVKKAEYAGAVKSLDTKILKSSQNINFADALIGTTPGLLIQENFRSPTAQPTILLRGMGSINSATQPLFVVDGVQMPGNIAANINSNDIQEIVVLKDAAATSIYGSKGSNGVIIVTTKQGLPNQGLTVTINSRASFAMPDIGFTKDLMNATEKLNWEEKMGVYKNNPALLATRRAYNSDLNWAKLLVKNGTVNSHNVSIQGGGKSANYYTSFGYDDEINLYGSKFNRFTGNFRINYRILKNLQVNVGANYAQSRLDDLWNAGDPLGNAFSLNPWEKIYDNNGNYSRLLSSGAKNPLFTIQNITDLSKTNNISGNFGIDYKPFTWWTLHAGLGGNISFSDRHAYENIVLSGGKLTKTNSKSENYTTNITSRFHKNFAKHSASLLFGYEVNESKYSGNYAFNTGYLSDVLQIIEAGGGTPVISTTGSSSGSLSYFSGFDYSYDQTYNLSLTARKDGSSKFGTNNRYANFWSAAASWNLNKTFNLNPDKIDYLKLRGSVGTSGNDFIGDFTRLSLYQLQLLYDGKKVPTISRLENPNLTWEKNKNINLGFDFGILKNRISGTFDYYIRDTYDLINQKQLPDFSGNSAITYNIGNIQNKGIEVSLNTLNVKTQNFSWESTINFTQNKGRITSLAQSGGTPQVMGNVSYEEGKVINALKYIEWLGVNPQTGFNQYRGADGTVVEFNGTNGTAVNNLIQTSDKTSIPTYFGGFFNTLRYKQFELGFLISFSGGNYILNSLYGLYNDPEKNQSKEVYNAWQNPGDQANMAKRQLTPALDIGKSSQFLNKGDYIKLKNVTFTYHFKKDDIKSLGINDLNIFVQGQNLLSFSEIKYNDPEYANIMSGGIGYSTTMVRKYALGLNLTF